MSIPRTDDWNFENGKERLWYAEDASGTSSYQSHVAAATRIYAPFYHQSQGDGPAVQSHHQQERDHNEQFLERLCQRNRKSTMNYVPTCAIGL